eukprot:Blabericola_migrator_1__1161@NODE_129_length_13297_cov_112_007559_g114_i0_p5_GENE_NODE_129_length_13297_cov_112_007559_g114_i0NODE_129_length_13297_cov_112_007559_g114_i0_p5_ORF_typecomplete_len245_score29_03PUD1_2/PF18457_1/1_4e42_NODE_129_length_13297_cov_112_007559_g114_i087929526
MVANHKIFSAAHSVSGNETCLVQVSFFGQAGKSDEERAAKVKHFFVCAKKSDHFNLISISPPREPYSPSQGTNSMVNKRTANACVFNKTAKPIYDVRLIHKYSSVYKDHKTWPKIEANSCSDTTEVRYHTGFMTTGVDWWALVWIDAENQVCKSNPNNFRWLIDMLETFGPGVAHKLLPNKCETIVDLTANAFLNSESTVGFKQHMLTDADADKPVVVKIWDGARMTIEATAGASETVWTRAEV